MRVGQLIGAGTNKQVSLVCVITGIDENEVRATVVNGNWKITFRPTVTYCHAPSGDHAIDAKILYTGDLPPHLRLEYYCSATCGEIFDLMNKRINSHIPMWVYSIVSNIRVRTSRFTNAWSAGKTAFAKSWKYVDDPHVYDDDIPF